MKFSASDALVSCSIAVGVCALFWLFTVDMNAVTRDANQKALGTVVFKKMSATRRPSDALGWERMQNNGPIYNSDTLRTGDFSEASVHFDDGTSLDLGSNSMLHLDFGSKTRNLEFLDGEITVGGSTSASNYAISSKSGTITVGKDSSATFSRDKDTVSVEVTKGDATFVKADGSKQAIAENQALAVSVKDGTSTLVTRAIIPVKPESNARILRYADGNQSTAEEGEVTLDFAWKLDASADKKTADDNGKDSPYTIEVSSTKDFADDTRSIAVNGLSTKIPVTPGSWFWRLKDGAGNESPVRKFSVTEAASPTPAFPDDGASYEFRTIKPEIRFAWTSMEDANAYLFELSPDAAFTNARIKTRVNGTNLSINDLDAGAWYWRVKPIHAFTEVIGEKPAVVRTLTIKKSASMMRTDLGTPFNGMLYQIQELDGKGLAFAWIPQAEAKSYELVVSASAKLTSPVLTLKADQPFVKIVGAQCGALLKSGTWYWAVRWIDREGNRSPDSEVRKLTGVDGSIAIRSVFPPNGYRIADSLASNTRFSWKSNVAAKTIFLVSRNADFSDILYQETVTSETLLGKAWGAGTYYWKLRTLNIDGSLFKETDARAFTIAEPLPGPALAAPAPGTLFYLREHDGITLTWNPVAGADYYSIGIYSPTDNYARAVFERGMISKTTIDYTLGDLPSGNYHVKIQGFTMESDSTTRIIGYIGESTLAYKRLSYIALLSPANGSQIPGLDAIRKGVALTYQTENIPDRQEFVLYRGSASGEAISRAAGKGPSLVQKHLTPGKYFWTVTGKVLTFDISAKDVYGFEILPVKPLPKTELLEPETGATFDAERIRKNRTIEFKWKPVDSANRYALSIYGAGSNTPIFVNDSIKEDSFVLKDLAALAKGTLRWTIEARSYTSEGDLEQPGLPAESSFEIDLPQLKRPASKNGGTLYGR